MLLHTVSKSPTSSFALASCLRCIDDHAVLLLLEDGVYAAVANGEAARAIASHGVACHVLRADVEARGLSGKLDPRFQLADYDDFVNLSTTCHAVQGWY